MAGHITKPKLIKKEVEVILSAQAQMVLAGTKYTEKQFIEWALVTNKISFGGTNVMIFLEKMHQKGVDEENGGAVE